MRILVDQSGYELLNLGDVAMLQVCVGRLKNLWPNADIDVLTRSPQRLRQFCPGATAVTPDISPRKSRRSDSRRLPGALWRADLVVSSGGGFINDVFWFHGKRVLTLLSLAQRLGKPTAMFSQGIGPLTHPKLTRLVTRIMPRLLVIGLREGLGSVPVLRARRVNPELIHVTGDDALLLATTPERPPTGTAIGLNMRVAPYSEIDSGLASRAGVVTAESASRRGVTALPLPVSRYQTTFDLDAIQNGASGRENGARRDADDILTPEELAERAARCRVVVTASYHAAVFGLAAGVPAVCVTNSRYYDLKFAGLGAQFPGGCHIVRPGPCFERELSDAIDRAWDASESDRDHMHSAAKAQIAQADHVYTRFKSLVAATAT
ncbi:polysaccharide pyruvyl transferase family protein [Mycobacterium lacus]|uniref:polysaccharide pyruvyl transferase family protein n=1 Tax=Mycobacterium lacus TaxID=169765 RepID=UPI0013D78E00|nr:polysaccharide pyruvyl transferase family protein [Mycobacterium lacus]MCV7124424.1 polysaccharide pyruvyl transferase family protein [Mycobacterium lacus]